MLVVLYLVGLAALWISAYDSWDDGSAARRGVVAGECVLLAVLSLAVRRRRR